MAAAQVANLTSPKPMFYQHSSYQALPSLVVAANIFMDKSLDSLLQGEGVIRSFFLKHDIHKEWGIVLLHKHFDISPGDRLVEFGNTSTPWRAETKDSTFEKYGGLVVPRSYKLLDGQFTPYEFAYMPGTIPGKNVEIPEGVGKLLQSLGAEHILGLRFLEGRQPDFNVEVTEHNANVMVPRGCMPDDTLIPAVWIFEPEDDDRCNCREYCSKESWGHVKTHGCG